VKGIFARRGRLVLVALVVAALTAGLSVTAASASRHSNITLTIDVFGDFGYHALYQQYEASHPGITIKEDTEGYAPHHTALAQHLATGAGADDIEAIEVGFIGQYTAQPGSGSRRSRTTSR
jgi:cellobiose transport system substrate-binding protein